LWSGEIVALEGLENSDTIRQAGLRARKGTVMRDLRPFGRLRATLVSALRVFAAFSLNLWGDGPGELDWLWHGGISRRL